MGDHAPDFQLFLLMYSIVFIDFSGCVPNVHICTHAASKPVLVRQNCQSILHNPFWGWFLILLWWQFSIPQSHVNFSGIYCFRENPTDKNPEVDVWWVLCAFYIAFSAHESLFQLMSQPSKVFVCRTCGIVSLKPLWSSPNPLPGRPSEAHYLSRTAM